MSGVGKVNETNKGFGSLRRVEVEREEPIDLVRKALEEDLLVTEQRLEVEGNVFDPQVGRIHGMLHDLADPEMATEIVDQFLTEARIQTHLFESDDRAELEQLIISSLRHMLEKELESIARATSDAIMTVPEEPVRVRSVSFKDLKIGSIEIPGDVQKQFSNTWLLKGMPIPQSTIKPEEATVEWGFEEVQRFVDLFRVRNELDGVGKDEIAAFHERSIMRVTANFVANWDSARSPEERTEAIETALRLMPADKYSPRLRQAFLACLGETTEPETIEGLDALFDFCEAQTGFDMCDDQPFFDLNDAFFLKCYVSDELAEIEELPIGHEDAVSRINSLLRVAAHALRLNNYSSYREGVAPFMSVAQRAGRADLADMALNLWETLAGDRAFR